MPQLPLWGALLPQDNARGPLSSRNITVSHLFYFILYFLQTQNQYPRSPIFNCSVIYRDIIYR
jgi:hypothetical protein